MTDNSASLMVEARELLGADARPLAGGYSGETFLVGAAGEQAVLRLYLRDPERAAVDAALLSLVRDLVPVPHVLELRTMATPDEPAFMVMERLPGVRLDHWLPDASPELRRQAGDSVGRLLARLAGMPFLRAGRFVGPDLAVEQWTGAAGGLEEWVEAHRNAGSFARWTAEEFAGLLDVARQGQDLLDTVERVCLCHSDFNPKNLLVDPLTGQVTGLVDWEFAHAGSPYTDVGNLLRFEEDEMFATSVVGSLGDFGPPLDPDFLDIARAVDLLAVVDLVGRPRENPVTRAADQLALRIARGRDLAGGRPDWRTALR
ncbi:phosphotransferase family protein [Actinopolymorpha alba]|uniref:phosphotransferase family protein n=1 Tax=Actinopolymorpha alba TaxID=533267 RepID=UPI0003624CF8|nr:phosphotransferase [Actinopolymorpha alba]